MVVMIGFYDILVRQPGSRAEIICSEMDVVPRGTSGHHGPLVLEGLHYWTRLNVCVSSDVPGTKSRADFDW